MVKTVQNFGFSAKQLYVVASHVESYPKWISNIQKAHVDRRAGSNSFKASLEVRYAALTETYTSKVICTPFTRIYAFSDDSNLFKLLTNTWEFHPLLPSSAKDHPFLFKMHQEKQYPFTKISFSVAFEFRNPLYNIMSPVLVEGMVPDMISNYRKRCSMLYGKEVLPLDFLNSNIKSLSPVEKQFLEQLDRQFSRQ